MKLQKYTTLQPDALLTCHLSVVRNRDSPLHCLLGTGDTSSSASASEVESNKIEGDQPKVP